LDVKPAYMDGMGSNKQWNLSINGKPYSLGEIKLSPNKYSVKLSHDCYEDIGFSVGINKDRREVFDMASILKPKNGGLALSAEKGGEPVSEPVFVNGRRVGETPFSGAVPICAKIEIGENRETVSADLKHNEKIKYIHRYSAYNTYTAPQQYSYTPTYSTKSSTSTSSVPSGIETKWGFTFGMPIYILQFALYSDADPSSGFGMGFYTGPKFGIFFNDVVSLNFEGNFVYKYMEVIEATDNIKITELALSLPILLKISGENYYLEGGIQYDMPFYTTIAFEDYMGDSEEEDFSTRAKRDIGIVVGYGYAWSNVDFGMRFVFATGDFDEYKMVSDVFTTHFVLNVMF